MAKHRMKPPNRKTILIVSTTLLLVGMSLVLTTALTRVSDLPVYEGKNVEEWFYGEDGHPGKMLTVQAAEKAFEKMGTNSIPFLISKLKAEDTLIQVGYCKLFPKLPVRIQKKLPLAINASYVQEMARHHLEAIPIQRLKSFANEIPDLYPRLRNKSYRRGISFLDNKSFFQPVKLKDKTSHILTVIEDGVPIEKLDAAILLSKVDSTITNGIPILFHAVTNRPAIVSILEQNSTSTPASLDYMASQHQKEAHEALSRIAPDLAKQYLQKAPQP